MKLSRAEKESKKTSYIKFLYRYFEFKSKGQQERNRWQALSQKTKPLRQSCKLRRMANPSLKRKLGGGAEYKIPKFQKPDYFHILGSLLQTVLR